MNSAPTSGTARSSRREEGNPSSPPAGACTVYQVISTGDEPDQHGKGVGDRDSRTGTLRARRSPSRCPGNAVGAEARRSPPTSPNFPEEMAKRQKAGRRKGSRTARRNTTCCRGSGRPRPKLFGDLCPGMLVKRYRQIRQERYPISIGEKAAAFHPRRARRASRQNARFVAHEHPRRIAAPRRSARHRHGRPELLRRSYARYAGEAAARCGMNSGAVITSFGRFVDVHHGCARSRSPRGLPWKVRNISARNRSWSAARRRCPSRRRNCPARGAAAIGGFEDRILRVEAGEAERRPILGGCRRR